MCMKLKLLSIDRKQSPRKWYHQLSLIWHQLILIWHQLILIWHELILIWHQLILIWHQLSLIFSFPMGLLLLSFQPYDLIQCWQHHSIGLCREYLHYLNSSHRFRWSSLTFENKNRAIWRPYHGFTNSIPK